MRRYRETGATTVDGSGTSGKGSGRLDGQRWTNNAVIRRPVRQAAKWLLPFYEMTAVNGSRAASSVHTQSVATSIAIIASRRR